MEEAYSLIAKGLALVPLAHYLLALTAVSLAYLYNLLDFHLLRDAVSFFRGSRVLLTFHPSSPLYDAVVSKCNVLRGRYLATPWLSSPHLQVFFLHFFGRPPSFTYSREIFLTSDGGTIALDWLLKSEVVGGSFHERDERTRSRDNATPIVLVIPGLASDSHCKYIKHAVFSMAKSGWNVVVSNHRGLGGVSITSDCFYNAGWTEDARAVIGYLHNEYPKAPLFAIGTSIGANILVKYLGEDGEKSPLRGAAAICNPWDLLALYYGVLLLSYFTLVPSTILLKFSASAMVNYTGDAIFNHKEELCSLGVGGSNIFWKHFTLARMFKGTLDATEHIQESCVDYNQVPVELVIGDRFICRTLVQKVYDRALTIGLQDFAKLHESHLTRLANWEGIKKSRSIRDFDNHATCHVGKFETVDTYYRRCSSSYYVGNVAVPLLCISALDDPLCTREAIPWDECRSNKMIVLATPLHGAHLAFFEGLTATSLWWVRAANEFLDVLRSSPCMHIQKGESENETPSSYALERSHIDRGPYVNVGEGGMVAAMSGEQAEEMVQTVEASPSCNQDQPHKHVRYRTGADLRRTH